jgi:hypothetical protein
MRLEDKGAHWQIVGHSFKAPSRTLATVRLKGQGDTLKLVNTCKARTAKAAKLSCVPSISNRKLTLRLSQGKRIFEHALCGS